MTEYKNSRRTFINMLIGGGALATVGSILYPLYKYLKPPLVAEANISQLKLQFKRDDIAAEPKKAKYFKYGKDLGIIFLTNNGNLKALMATCTHLDCTVQNQPEQGFIWCACHNGKYTVDGKNISGPPPRPLQSFLVKEEGETIFVSLGENT